MRDYQESVTTGQTDEQTDGQTDARQSDPNETYLCMTTKKVWLPDRQTPDKVIPMCGYASQKS